jgi:hypothetical protein
MSPKQFYKIHKKNGGDLSFELWDGTLPKEKKQVRKANPKLKKYNHKFIKLIEVLYYEII